MQQATSWTTRPGPVKEYPLVIAHRGDGNSAPENTLAAFRRALEIGADGIELDVRLTRDNQVVVFHDRKVDRTTPGKGPVGRFSLRELKSLDAGSWFGPEFKSERVPTLAEVFEVLPRDTLLIVELKVRGAGTPALALRAAQVIRRYGRWEATLVTSFNPIALVLFRALEPRVPRGYIWSSRHPLPLRAGWLSPLVNPLWMNPDRGTFTTQLLARFHAQGKPVLAWDLDAGTDMQRLREMGLDAVVTDHPQALVRQKTEKRP